jgi:hypothetical protein
MEGEERQSKARPGFRVAAGIISVLFFTIGLPVSVIMAVRGDWSMWLFAFTQVLVGIDFATVTLTGRSFCFRKVYHKSNR